MLLSPRDTDGPDHDYSDWYAINQKWDERWFIGTDFETAMERLGHSNSAHFCRLAKRHVETGICSSMEDAVAR